MFRFFYVEETVEGSKRMNFGVHDGGGVSFEHGILVVWLTSVSEAIRRL